MNVAIGIGLVGAIPWLGWRPNRPLLAVVGFYSLVQPWIASSPRPEYPSFLTLLKVLLMLASCSASAAAP